MSTREDELLALEAIYDSETFGRDDAKLGGQLRVVLDLKEPIVVACQQEERSFRHFPPLVIHFELPDDYPEASPPKYTLSSQWLTVEQLSKLCSKLDELWQPGEVVLYEWYQYLSESTLDELAIAAAAPIRLKPPTTPTHEQSHPSALQTCTSLDRLWSILVDHDDTEMRRAFDAAHHACAVCMATKSGTQSIRIRPCNHVYCRACVKDYFEYLIRQGAVASLSCLDTDCKSTMDPNIVKELVEPALFSRYDRLLLQGSLDGMSDVVYCPRATCRCAVICDGEHATMGVCTRCTFAFCVLCEHAWHGVAPCQLNRVELRRVKTEYEAAATAAQRAYVERKYGKRNVRRAIEEVVSEEWIEEYTKACPSCGASIEKLDGCNMMTCMKCRAHFCWLCKRVLSRSSPYEHFSIVGSDCFNLLFQGMVDEIEFA
ncbi:E3 ubiquitin-protein ligase RNF14-like [Oscarella lobularis]|uniref:E3 ubiquitin-protein ligase RNF14-like n=1 Tax=Oscarella lobularis TaxID=121494 RepID=UPI0033132F41